MSSMGSQNRNRNPFAFFWIDNDNITHDDLFRIEEEHSKDHNSVRSPDHKLDLARE